MNVWYIRRKGEVKGPYPAGLITRYVLLGRLLEDDEISPDRNVWTLLREHRELIPEVMKAAITDPATQQRLEAARRWADERNTQRRTQERMQSAGGAEQRATTSDRRNSEDAPIVQYRLTRTARDHEHEKSTHQWIALVVIIGVVGTIIAALVYFYKPPPPDEAVNCSSAPTPKVNWSNCTLDGAQLSGADLVDAKLYSAKMTGANLRGARLTSSNLSYATMNLASLDGADLRGANLVGASLRRARLANAHLERADLSYADLTGAELSGVALGEAKLGNAIWPDGKVCAPESVGTCVAHP